MPEQPGAPEPPLPPGSGPPDELEEAAREVTSGRPCPKCGFPMEPGYLAAATYRFFWTFDPPRAFHTLVQDTIGVSRHSADVSLAALRCPECRHIEIDY